MFSVLGIKPSFHTLSKRLNGKIWKIAILRSYTQKYRLFALEESRNSEVRYNTYAVSINRSKIRPENWRRFSLRIPTVSTAKLMNVDNWTY